MDDLAGYTGMKQFGSGHFMEAPDINSCGKCDEPDTMLGNAPKSHGPMPTLRILVKVVPQEEVPVAHEEVGVVVDKEAGVVRVEDGRILAVVDEETV